MLYLKNVEVHRIKRVREKEIKISSEYDRVGEACELFRKFCLQNKIADIHSVKLEICLTEALNNVIKHSYEEKPGNDINLKISYDSEKIVINISETGKPRKKIEKPTLDFDPEDIDNLPESGMGLFIIEEIMDETKYHSDGKINTFNMIKNL